MNQRLQSIMGLSWLKKQPIIGLGALAFAVLVTGFVALLSTSTTSYATGPTETIVSANKKCLDNYYAQVQDGNKVQLWDCNGTGAQKWQITSDGTVRLKDTTYCLDVKWGEKNDMTPVWLYSCNGTDAQKWNPTVSGTLVNTRSGKCLDNRYDERRNGNQIVIFTCGRNDSSQQWKLPAVTDTSVPLPPVDTPKTPSGEAMPTGDVSGWKQSYAEDFKTDSPAGSFETAYKNTWCGYDTNTQYHNSEVLSAHDGVMDFKLDGKVGGAGWFGNRSTTGTTDCGGQTYGRFAMRIKAVNAADNGTAIMLWPNSDIWSDGEIDFPEGNFDQKMGLYHHTMNCNGTCPNYDSMDDIGGNWQQWNTVAVEWEPTAVRYYLNGKLLKTVTGNVPTVDHRYTIQMAPNGANPQPGNFLVDWVTMYTRT